MGDISKKGKSKILRSGGGADMKTATSDKIKKLASRQYKSPKEVLKEKIQKQKDYMGRQSQNRRK